MYDNTHQDLNWDKLYIEKGINDYDFPEIKNQHIDYSKILNLIPYNEQKQRNGFTHFFMYDYMFTRVWNKPTMHLNKLKSFEGAISPDYSLYADYPLALQVYNIYRNRWCGRYWQEHDILVVPSVSWATEDTFDFCFQGIEKGSMVAISNVGTRKEKGCYEIFQNGFKEMMKQLEPEHILLYGTFTDDLIPYKDIITSYKSYCSCWR